MTAMRHASALGIIPAVEPASRPPFSSGDTPQRPAGSRVTRDRVVILPSLTLRLRPPAFAPVRDAFRLPRGCHLCRPVAQARPVGRIALARGPASSTPVALIARTPSPTLPFAAGLRAPLRSELSGRRPGRKMGPLKRRWGSRPLALVAPLAHPWSAKPDPCGLPHCSPGVRRAVLRRGRLRPVHASRYCSLRCAPP